MFTKTAFALAFMLATASGALAAKKPQSFEPCHDGSQIRLDDCIHVTFPQCDGNASQTQADRP
jgi:hypothetical protein